MSAERDARDRPDLARIDRDRLLHPFTSAPEHLEGGPRIWTSASGIHIRDDDVLGQPTDLEPELGPREPARAVEEEHEHEPAGEVGEHHVARPVAVQIGEVGGQGKRVGGGDAGGAETVRIADVLPPTAVH